MALHSELDIYKTASDLLAVATDLTRNIDRAFKRQFSDLIVNACIEITILIIDANIAVDKSGFLTELLRLQKKAELLIRLFNDRHWISPKQYAAAMKLTVSLGKQAGGWKASSQRRPLYRGQGPNTCAI